MSRIIFTNIRGGLSLFCFVLLITGVAEFASAATLALHDGVDMKGKQSFTPGSDVTLPLPSDANVAMRQPALAMSEDRRFFLIAMRSFGSDNAIRNRGDFGIAFEFLRSGEQHNRTFWQPIERDKLGSVLMTSDLRALNIKRSGETFRLANLSRFLAVRLVSLPRNEVLCAGCSPMRSRFTNHTGVSSETWFGRVAAANRAMASGRFSS